MLNLRTTLTLTVSLTLNLTQSQTIKNSFNVFHVTEALFGFLPIAS